MSYLGPPRSPASNGSELLALVDQMIRLADASDIEIEITAARYGDAVTTRTGRFYRQHEREMHSLEEPL